jgi:hypothetical protein
VKITAFRTGDEVRVGAIDEKRGTLCAFDLPLSEAREGVLALVERRAIPDARSPIPLAEVVLEAPLPRPRRNIFCPTGPWPVTREEVDLRDTQVRCWINGELRQDANTRDLVFGVPSLIATISVGVTLMPDDIIATGTPAGAGIARIEISGIGALENAFRETSP